MPKPNPKIFYVLGPNIADHPANHIEEFKDALMETGLKEEDIHVVDMSSFKGEPEDAIKMVNDEFTNFTKDFKEDDSVTYILNQHGGVAAEEKHRTQTGIDKESGSTPAYFCVETSSLLTAAEELSKKNTVSLFIADCYGSNYLDDNPESTIKNVSAVGGFQEYASADQFDSVIEYLSAGEYVGPVDDKVLLQISMLSSSFNHINTSMTRVNLSNHKDCIVDMEGKLYELIHAEAGEKLEMLGNAREKLIKADETGKIGFTSQEFSLIEDQILSATKLNDINTMYYRQAMLVAYTADTSPNLSEKEIKGFKKVNEILDNPIFIDRNPDGERAKKRDGLLVELKQTLDKMEPLGNNSNMIYDKLLNCGSKDAIQIVLDHGFDFDAKILFNTERYSRLTLMEDICKQGPGTELFQVTANKFDPEKMNRSAVELATFNRFMYNLTSYSNLDHDACKKRISNEVFVMNKIPGIITTAISDESPIKDTTIELVDSILKLQGKENFLDAKMCIDKMKKSDQADVQQANTKLFLTVLKRTTHTDGFNLSYLEENDADNNNRTKAELAFGQEGAAVIRKFIDEELHNYQTFNNFKSVVMKSGRDGFDETETSIILRHGRQDKVIDTKALVDENNNIFGFEISMDSKQENGPKATITYSPKDKLKKDVDIIR